PPMGVAMSWADSPNSTHMVGPASTMKSGQHLRPISSQPPRHSSLVPLVPCGLQLRRYSSPTHTTSLGVHGWQSRTTSTSPSSQSLPGTTPAGGVASPQSSPSTSFMHASGESLGAAPGKVSAPLSSQSLPGLTPSGT